MTHRKRKSPVFLLTFFFCLNALADGLPDGSRELQRQEQEQQQLRQRNESRPDVRLQSEAPVVSNRLIEETPCFPIHSIRFTGDSFDDALLRSALNGSTQDDAPQGKCLGSQNIQLLLNRVQNALIAKGFITSRVALADQDLKSGELVFTLLAGRIGKIRAKDEQQLPALASFAIKGDSLLNLRDLEQSLENLRRLPSRDANIEIVPTDKPGYSDILIDYQAKRPLRLNLSIDDNGSKSTGKIQGNATASWDNPLGLSDMLYLSTGQALAKQEPGNRGSDNHVVHYSFPLGYWQLSATAGRNRYHQTIFGAFQDYLYSGKSNNAELQASRVLHRNANSKTSASASVFSKSSRNYIEDTEVEVQRRRTAGWELAMQHTHYLGRYTWDGQLSYRRGTGAFGAIPAPEELFGEGTSRMQLTQANLSLQFPFEWLERKLNYSGQLRLQWNQTPLSPQERFCIGGRYTVRGFDGRQSLCADRGQLWRNEISSNIPKLPLQVFTGLDWGAIGGQSAEFLPGKNLTGAVLGVRGAIPIWQRNLQFEIFAAQVLRKPDLLYTNHTSSGFSMAMGF